MCAQRSPNPRSQGAMTWCLCSRPAKRTTAARSCTFACVRGATATASRSATRPATCTNSPSGKRKFCSGCSFSRVPFLAGCLPLRVCVFLRRCIPYDSRVLFSHMPLPVPLIFTCPSPLSLNVVHGLCLRLRCGRTQSGGHHCIRCGARGSFYDMQKSLGTVRFFLPASFFSLNVLLLLCAELRRVSCAVLCG